jgi:hypothetical protein
MTEATDKKKNYLTEEQIDKQEHLSKERLEMLSPREDWDCERENERPKANLIDLMHWVRVEFGHEISDLGKEGRLNCWIHNKIVIDGAFIEFAEQKGVKIECLYRDSIASWKSDKENEHFMAQGVFKISRGDLEFLHAALFHKGNQNEDEVSFFVIMDDEDFEKYTALRNEFDNWLVERDREHLEIHVIGGEGQPYERDMSWDEVFLPEKLKKDIIDAVEGFLAAKELYEEKKIAWKRGILLWGDPGNGKTTTIKTIISRYDFKPVTVQTSPQTNDDTITQAFEYAQEQEPGLLYFEDLDSLLKMGTVSVSHFLNLLDGVSTKNGILVMATANDLRGLNEAIIDRPSRFDRKWEIPLPDEKMAKAYLHKWFGDALSAKSMNIIIKSAVEGNFSYAYLKELYITSAYHALAGGRKNPNLKDIQRAMEQMLTDKKNVQDGFQPEHHEEIGIR